MHPSPSISNWNPKLKQTKQGRSLQCCRQFECVYALAIRNKLLSIQTDPSENKIDYNCVLIFKCQQSAGLQANGVLEYF